MGVTLPFTIKCPQCDYTAVKHARFGMFELPPFVLTPEETASLKKILGDEHPTHPERPR